MGNCPQCTDAECAAFFNDAIGLALPPRAEHLVGAHVSGTDKRFAFIEFKSVEMCTAVLERLNGCSFRGEVLRMTRPKDTNMAAFPAPAGPPPAFNLQPLVERGILSAAQAASSSARAARRRRRRFRRRCTTAASWARSSASCPTGRARCSAAACPTP